MIPEKGSRRRRKRRNIFTRYRILIAAFALAVAGVVIWVATSSQKSSEEREPPAAAISNERTAALPAIDLPADDAPHKDKTEWWYYNGHLKSETGVSYSFHVAVFLKDMGIRHTVFHVSVTDDRSGKRYTRQVRTAGVPQAEDARGFDFRHGDWRVAGFDAKHTVIVREKDFSLELNLNDLARPVLHRQADSATPGLLDFGDAGISYYYSRPRMDATGSLTIDGARSKVVGKVWFDHQWGNFEAADQGWNWFALQLDNGADLMLYQIFDKAGKKQMTIGSYSQGDKLTILSEKDIQLRPTGVWISPKYPIRYPAGWDIRIPAGSFVIQPQHADSLFDALETTFNLYWEGAVSVKGGPGGSGFLEMSGYDHIPAMQMPK